VKVANTCCNGRVVSALEGGYKIHGGIVSPFARSVASHVRALVDGGSSREEYDVHEGEWESHFERDMNEEKEKKRQFKMDKHSRVVGGMRPISSPHQPELLAFPPVKHQNKSHVDTSLQFNIDNSDQPSRKRNRRHVDYKHLFKQMKKEGY